MQFAFNALRRAPTALPPKLTRRHSSCIALPPTAPMASSLSRFELPRGRVLRLQQFFFDRGPVPQPQGSRLHADGTGLKVWPTSMPLLFHLQRLISERFTSERPLRILELGSGCGLLGLGLAATCSPCDIVLTDPAVAVNFEEDGESGSTIDWLRENVELNRDVVGQSRVRVEPLRWGDAQMTNALMDSCDRFDLVVGSDLMYEPDRYPALLSSLHTFATSDRDGNVPAAVLGYPTRHGGEQRFLKQVDEGSLLKVGSTIDLGTGQGGAGRFSATHLHRAVRCEGS